MRKPLTKSTMGVLIVACLLILTVFIGSFVLVGCAPSGFHRGWEYPFSISGFPNHPPDISVQFPDLNDEFDQAWWEASDLFFMFEDRLHHVNRITGSIYNGEVSLGRLVEIGEEWRTDQQQASYQIILLHGNHIYYSLHKNKTIFRFMGSGWFDHRANYSRNEWHRFNLNTGGNEEIRLTQFVEALQTIDSNWVIHPNYRGER